MEQPPFVKGSETSEAAAQSMRTRVFSDAHRIYNMIEAAGSRGLTCDEIAAQLGRVNSSMSARLCALKNSGAFLLSGEERPTRSRRGAKVYIKGGPFGLYCEFEHKEDMQRVAKKMVIDAAQAFKIAETANDMDALEQAVDALKAAARRLP